MVSSFMRMHVIALLESSSIIFVYSCCVILEKFLDRTGMLQLFKTYRMNTLMMILLKLSFLL